MINTKEYCTDNRNRNTFQKLHCRQMIKMIYTFLGYGKNYRWIVYYFTRDYVYDDVQNI